MDAVDSSGRGLEAFDTETQRMNSRRREATTLRRASKLTGDYDYAGARKLLLEAINGATASIRLSNAITDTYIDEGRYVEAARWAYRAYVLHSQQASVVAKYIRALRYSRSLVSAIDLRDELPDRLRYNPKVQHEMSSVYDLLGWKVDRRLSRRMSGSSGGRFARLLDPLQSVLFKIIRARLEILEYAMLSNWASGLRRAVRVDPRYNDEWLDARIEVENYLVRWVKLNLRMRISAAVFRPLVPIALALIAAFLGPRLSTTSPLGGVAVSGTWLGQLVAASLAIGTYYLFVVVWRGRRYAGSLHRLIPLAAGLAVLSYVLTRQRTAILYEWWLGYGLVIGAMIVVATMLFWRMYQVYTDYLARTMWSAHPRAAILDLLFDTAHEIEYKDRRGDLAWRRTWLARLEQAARIMTRELTRATPTLDRASRSWLESQAQGGAANLRRMKRMLLAPASKGWDRLSRLLTQHYSAISAGDWGAIPYTKPSRGDVKRDWRTRAVQLGKGVVVAFVPLGILVFIEVVLGVSPQAFEWARLAAGAWAIVSLIFAIDPEAKEKIQSARELAASVHEARSRDVGVPVQRRGILNDVGGYAESHEMLSDGPGNPLKR